MLQLSNQASSPPTRTQRLGRPSTIISWPPPSFPPGTWLRQQSRERASCLLRRRVSTTNTLPYGKVHVVYTIRSAIARLLRVPAAIPVLPRANTYELQPALVSYRRRGAPLRSPSVFNPPPPPPPVPSCTHVACTCVPLHMQEVDHTAADPA